MRWGIAGFGWVARDHALSALRTAGHRIAGVADPSPISRARAEADGLAAHATVAELLAAGGLDAL